MKPKKYVVFICCLLNALSIGSVEYMLNETALEVNARDLALGGLVCTMENSPYRTVECTYSIPYMLKEISIRTLNFHTSIFGLGWTFGWYQSGNFDWMENAFKAHLEKQLNEHLLLGIEGVFLFQKDATESTSWACFPQVNCNYELSEKISLGLTLINPSGVQMNTEYEKVSLSIAAFLATRFIPAKKCLLYAEVCAWTNQQVKGRLGLEYTMSKTFVLRTGFSTCPTMPCWGIGGSLHPFSYSWGGNYHPILGISNAFSLNYSW